MNETGNLLSIEITYDCNLRCPWCIRGGLVCSRPLGTREGVIPPHLFEKLMLYIKKHPYDIYLFQGGEPLCYPSEMFEMMSHIREMQPNAKFRIFTNGTLLTREVTDELNMWEVFPTISLEGSGYKGIMNFIRHSPEPDFALDNLRALKQKNLRIVVTREKLKNGGLAEDIAMLRAVAGDVEIEAALDLTDLRSFTCEDIALYHKRLAELGKIMPNYNAWFMPMQGFTCRCNNDIMWYILADDAFVPKCPNRPINGCRSLKNGLAPEVYEDYVKLCKFVKGV